jgi:hypothetical protein
MVEMTGAQLADPKIEQRKVAKNAVEKLGGEAAIGGA